MTPRHLPRRTKVRILDGFYRGEWGVVDGVALSDPDKTRVLVGTREIPAAIQPDWLTRIDASTPTEPEAA